jgi:hypothetical protein
LYDATYFTLLMGKSSGAVGRAGAGIVSMILVVKALFEVGFEGKVMGGSGGGAAPSPRTLKVELVSVVWPETTATSACAGEAGEVGATGLFARQHLRVYSGLDLGDFGWGQECARPIYKCAIVISSCN